MTPLAGGIFDQEDDSLANHFTLAVERANRDLGLLGATKFQAKVFILSNYTELFVIK